MSIGDGQLGPTPLAAACSALVCSRGVFWWGAPLSAVHTSGGPTRGFVWGARVHPGGRLPPKASPWAALGGTLSPWVPRSNGLAVVPGYLPETRGPLSFFGLLPRPWATEGFGTRRHALACLTPPGPSWGVPCPPLSSSCLSSSYRPCIYKLKSTCKCTPTRRLRRFIARGPSWPSASAGAGAAAP